MNPAPPVTSARMDRDTIGRVVLRPYPETVPPAELPSSPTRRVQSRPRRRGRLGRFARPVRTHRPVRPRRLARLPLLRPPLAVSVALLLVGLTGCGGDEFEDRTAQVTVDGRSNTFQIDSCGLDQETVFVVGRADDGSILQAVVGVTYDGDAPADDRPDGSPSTGEPSVPDQDGVADATGITVDIEGSAMAAFGPEAWDRRGQVGEAPGLIGSAQVRGARIQVAGRLVPVDDQGGAVADAEAVGFELDARCDETTD